MMERITVIGGTAAGVEIAALAARGGFATCLHDRDAAGLAEAGRLVKERLESLDGGPGGKVQVAHQVRVRLEPSLEAAVGDADFVIEAACDDLAAKRALFARLDELAPAHAILATYSPTVSSAYLAAATSRPDRVVSLGFFTPPLAPAAVAVMQEPHLPADVLSAVAEVVWRMGREPLMLRRGREPEGASG
ncbi:MAG: 3-hydroxyacyl-CoA dehydrogenase NAD-binding domain-containing protein [Symbiobacterium sp.]|uniref:3-hydroxyacyl-CoA dehydrogenase NAD-binding domain-containing protein n=1 Tax=Symbiobacterium sp. TaxID=1971213 RepID=UPI0034649B7A